MTSLTQTTGRDFIAGVADILRRLTVKRWIAVMRERQRLAALEPHLLEDIGVGQDAAAREAARPFWSVDCQR
ncbi:MAG: DUF1127 domain-containing protein [Pseudomonadota bacterium]